jgi:hypothetical protein
MWKVRYENGFPRESTHWHATTSKHVSFDHAMAYAVRLVRNGMDVTISPPFGPSINITVNRGPV